MKKISLIITVCSIILVSCNKNEIVILNTSNPNYDLGIVAEDVKNVQTETIGDVYSLSYDNFGKKANDTLVRQSLTPVKLKLVTLSKEGKVLSEVLERDYRDNIPFIKVFGKEINLNPYLRGIYCEFMRNLTPCSYNNLIFYTLRIIGKSEKDHKYYLIPVTLMINTETKKTQIVGRGYYINDPASQNIQIIEDKYFGFLDFYMDSEEYITKYYDNEGNYVGWTPDLKENIVKVYTTPFEITNKDWTFTYGRDKYGRPISMKSAKGKYEIKYTNAGAGYRIISYDDKGRKIYEYEHSHDFVDFRNWNMVFNAGGKLTQYKYDSSTGALTAIGFFNKNGDCYLQERRRSDGSSYYSGIYKIDNKKSYQLVDVDTWYGSLTGTYPVYRINHKTGTRTLMANVSEKNLKKYLLDYLYKID